MTPRNHRRRRRSPAVIPPPSTAAIPEASESDYAFTITRIAVAQICRSLGFTAAESPALRTLTDVASRYLRSIAESASSSANSACRTQSNLLDAVAAVEDLTSVTTGFAGAGSTTAGCLLNSGAVKELIRFSKYSKEIPFAKPLPRRMFSTTAKPRSQISWGRPGESSSSIEYVGGERKHIPRWLPVMPVIGDEEEEGGKGKEMRGFGGESEGIERESEREENCVEKERERKGIELPIKRGKVKFKIGKGKGKGSGREVFGDGVLEFSRGGGIGKRVLCDNWVSDEEIQKRKKNEIDKY